jgi:hypothetical protein
LTQDKAKLAKNLIITLVFEKNANIFAENWQKSQKIVIITSAPGMYVPNPCGAPCPAGRGVQRESVKVDIFCQIMDNLGSGR